MNPEILAVTFGLTSALTWGAGDFSGGFATKRGNVFSVILFSQIIGALILVIWGLVFGERIPDQVFLAWGAIAGVCGTFGLLALYTALARYKMGIVAPLSAVVTAVIPVIFSLFTEEMPKSNQLIGFGVALVAVWFLTSTGKKHKTGKGEMGLALLAGLGFGLFFICIDRATVDVVLWPLVSARTASIFFLSLLMLISRQKFTPSKKQVPYVILAGLFDTAGNAFFALATNLGRLDVSSVLASLYPASTVILAWLLLREKLHSRQWLGVLAAIGALVLISL